MLSAGRTALLALLVAVPGLGTAAFFAFDNWALTHAGVATAPAPAKADLMDAVRNGDVLGAFAIARSGPGPRVPRSFRDETLTGGTDLLLTPFLLAAARNDKNMVLMLLTHMEPPSTRVRAMGACLVRARADQRLADVIAPGLPVDACPDSVDMPDLLRRYSLDLQQEPD